MESIFEKLDKLIKNTNVITESLEDGDEVGVEIDDEYKTSEQGITHAVLDVLNRVRNIEGKKEGSAVDYLRRLEKKLRLQKKIKASEEWKKSYKETRKKLIDIYKEKGADALFNEKLKNLLIKDED
jgi:hypothetical protein